MTEVMPEMAAATGTKNLPPDGPLIDDFGRDHTDMRVSLTDTCNYRCTYCMQEEQGFTPLRLNLDKSEIIRVASVAHELGIRSVRLTGGEPLLRHDVIEIVEGLSDIGFDDLSMTTNGSLLTRKVGSISMAMALKKAGLMRLNVSCDSLDDDKFARIRRRGSLLDVMDGIEEAHRVGFSPIKMNVVLMKNQEDVELENIDEMLDFVRYARKSHILGKPVITRFIEFMPLGETGEGQANWSPDKVVRSSEVLKIIKSVYPIEVASSQTDHAPASRWEFTDGMGEIGIIPTMTNPFCGNCDRLRMTAQGTLMACLFSEDDINLSVRNIMRQPGGCSDEDIANVFFATVAGKKAGQNRLIPDIFTSPGLYQVGGSKDVSGKTMSQIGG